MISMSRIFILFGIFIAITEQAPLDTTFGGVFQNTEAKSYFGSRFGSDFFARLSAKLSKVAEPNDRQSKKSETAETPKLSNEDKSTTTTTTEKNDVVYYEEAPKSSIKMNDDNALSLYYDLLEPDNDLDLYEPIDNNI